MHRGNFLHRRKNLPVPWTGHVHCFHRLVKCRQNLKQLSLGIHGEAAAVKYKLVVAPHLVYINKRQMVFPAMLSDDLVTDLFLAAIKRRSRNVDQQTGSLPGQFLNRIKMIQSAGIFYFIFVPGVLTN